MHDYRAGPSADVPRAVVRRVWERQGRLCALCERAIPFDLMHGDHIIPWSQGGRTDPDNCQALCSSCNLRKGSQPQHIAEKLFDVATLAPGTAEPRRWQREAIEVVLAKVLTEPMLVEACPGAGKTHFGLELCYRLIERGDISRVIIVAPTLGIADGWLSSAAATDELSPTLPLLGPRRWHPTQMIRERWVGCVTTYQSLFACTDMFIAHATDPGERTLVVFDEVHHAGAESGWGERAQEAFAKHATALLSLTGTPFRTQADPIVFVPSKDRVAAPHYRYGYEDAIADKACRPVQFVVAKGTATFKTAQGKVHTVDFDDQLTDGGSRKRLRTALEVVERGSIAHRLLDDANEYILRLRRAGDTDAAGLVVCVDCAHADRVAGFMKDVGLLQKHPVVAASVTSSPTDAKPADAIRSFKRSHDPWIVAVNMVSEGVDIRRLRAVVYLTNKLTILSFRQIVGRVVRSDPQNVDDHGRVYLPADPELMEMARTITDEVKVLPPPLVIDVEPRLHDEKIHADGQKPGQFKALSSAGEAAAAFDVSGRAASDELVELAERYVKVQGLTGTDPVSLALAASRNPALRKRMEAACG